MYPRCSSPKGDDKIRKGLQGVWVKTLVLATACPANLEYIFLHCPLAGEKLRAGMSSTFLEAS